MSDDDWDEEDGGDDGDDGWDEGGGDEWADEPMDDAAGGGSGPADDWTIEVENLFVTGESDRKDDPKGALAKLQRCVALEEEKSETVDKRFPALKHIVVLQFGFDQIDEMVSSYQKLLGYASKVTPNDLNNAIRSILNGIQGNNVALARMYEITLDFFQSQGKDRFWFEYAMRLCKTYYESRQLKQCGELLDKLHASCKLPNGEDDSANKAAQLLEIYALRMQIMSLQNNRAALNDLFERTSTLCADINDPRSMSIIKECWGKMYASMNDWTQAYQNFFDAFRSYQDIGHSNVRQCLKYVVLASMLSDTSTNPFASQEARVYQTNSEIIPIANLLDAFETDNIRMFESTCSSGRAFIFNDDFIKEHMPDVKLRLRSRVLVKLIKPYKRVKLEWLCRQLNATAEEIENLVVNLILDGSISGRLDQIHSLLDLNFLTETDKLYNALEGWQRSVSRLQNGVANRSSRSEMGGGRGMGMHMSSAYMDFEDDPFLGFADDVGDYHWM